MCFSGGKKKRLNFDEISFFFLFKIDFCFLCLFVLLYRYVCNEMTVKPESIATDQSSLDLDLAWTKLLGNSTPNNGSHVVIKLDNEKVSDTPNATTETAGLKKSPSWLGSFHNQIRSSIKIMTESPGPITR